MAKIQQTTLCVLHDGRRVLLAMKKRGFGIGKWNGYGGKLKEGEEVETAALRELEEESGIALAELEKQGLLWFHGILPDEDVIEVHVFAAQFSGDAKETEEMRPQWFAFDEIPYDTMWPDDRHWLPVLLQGKKFEGRFKFNKDGKIIEKELHELNDFVKN